ncbi:hypothetical protein [Alloalcanivorax xenomutans]|uniref:Uncharacterized protein n=1 Tax=Alloalcanivorax xenomutans TaxID=1094342 RepID=A0A9Q3ZEY3_9GAMM|nr:hypothetical protein [Alloalcanivorax xenomutans]MCE7511288.1 hypothetical protein [Alloalcanivorax xenomutans]
MSHLDLQHRVNRGTFYARSAVDHFTRWKATGSPAAQIHARHCAYMAGRFRLVLPGDLGRIPDLRRQFCRGFLDSIKSDYEQQLMRPDAHAFTPSTEVL